MFSGSTDGHLLAFATDDGHVLWDVDTIREYQTVDGVTATGGSLDGVGPVIVGGTLFVNSGYGRFGGMAGNVLLAFSVDGRQGPSVTRSSYRGHEAQVMKARLTHVWRVRTSVAEN